ncbi:MAG TPA: class I SAM-dependent methyltransferase, partial [Gammaproteobacteria bacterium]|nr:class I SAM-dependent methyltransferase [Gammaproteobacteria bacterium]
AYESYMGRWSRLLARPFVEWLAVAPGGHWLEVGCGTGALTKTICEHAEPASVVASDSAEAFVAHAREHMTDSRVSFVVAAADALPQRPGGFDAIVSGLVLNFVPQPERALAGMRERLSANGTAAAYVWDYANGTEFLVHFWAEAVAGDARAAVLDERTRFPLCDREALASAFRAAGFAAVQTTALVVPTVFADFDDFWKPFLGGTGPAPAYVMSLEPSRRDDLRDRLRRRLVAERDGSLRLQARAWAARGSRA